MRVYFMKVIFYSEERFLLKWIELVLADITDRADPVVWKLVKACFGRDSIFRIAGLWIVDIAAVGADIFRHNGLHYSSVKYFAWGWWTIKAAVVCSGII